MISDRAVILDTLRERICLVPPGENVVIKEKELATEFDLSRTPIRQVLQTLANEGLLAVKPGFGSVTTELRAQDRAEHMEVFRQLALASVTILGDSPVTEDAKMELSAIDGFVSNVEKPTPELFLRLNGRLLRALTGSLKDPILSYAFQAAQWRVVRWRTWDMVQNLDQNWTIFAGNISRAVGICHTCKAADLMDIAANAVVRYKDPESLKAANLSPQPTTLRST